MVIWLAFLGLAMASDIQLHVGADRIAVGQTLVLELTLKDISDTLAYLDTMGL